MRTPEGCGESSHPFQGAIFAWFVNFHSRLRRADSACPIDFPGGFLTEYRPMQTEIAAIIDALKHKPGALLPILHGIQDRIGYIPPEAVPVIAKALNLTRAEVHGVISFYHDFRSEAPGAHVVRICQAESCQAMGSDALTTDAKKCLGIDFHQTTRDKSFTLEPVYCLGMCAVSPAMMVDGELYSRLTSERLQQVLEEARERQ
jgi:formate dehydrogenase subunit gamma